MTGRVMLVMKDLGDSADFKKKNFKIISTYRSKNGITGGEHRPKDSHGPTAP